MRVAVKQKGVEMLKDIPINSFVSKALDLWANKWLLMAAGDFAAAKYNCMTIGWGAFGTMWRRPFAQVVVRPMRHTFGFMNDYDTFTLCAFPEKFKDALTLLGSKSGRDGDKIKESGLTPKKAVAVAAPIFAEAELAIECRKMYWDDFKPNQILDATIHKLYPEKDYHRIFYGEILRVRGVDAYKA